jgi:hypothetical protein
MNRAIEVSVNWDTSEVTEVERLEGELAEAKRLAEINRREDALGALGITGTTDTRAVFGLLAAAIVDLQNKEAA